MIIAAKMKEAHPALFDILFEPDRAPISYGVKIGKLVKALDADEFAEVIERAEDIAANGDQYKPSEVFAILQIGGAHPGEDAPQDDQGMAEEDDGVEQVFGHDDQPCGTKERLDDGAERLCLPPIAAVGNMTVTEREAAADAFHALIRKHFGLDLKA
jgi:hypothetical protein